MAANFFVNRLYVLTETGNFDSDLYAAKLRQKELEVAIIDAKASFVLSNPPYRLRCGRWSISAN